MRHRVLLLSFVSFIALQTFAASPLLTKLYEKKHEQFWAGYGDGVVETVLNDVNESRSADDLIARIRKSQRVTSESADAIAVAVIASNNGETLQADYAAIERMLLHAYATETNRAPLLTTLGSIAGYANDPEAAQRQLIELAGNDTTLAIAAANGARFAASTILGSAFERDPNNPRLIQVIAETWRHPFVRAAFGPLRITDRGVEMRGELETEATITQLMAIGGLALPELLLTAYDAIPPATQKEILAAEYGQSVRIDLSAAAMLAGQLQRARDFLPPPPFDEPEEAAGVRALLKALEPDAKDDPFDVITATFGVMGANEYGTRGLLLAMFAEKHGYSEFAAEVLRTAVSGRTQRGETPTQSMLEAMIPLQTRVDAAIARDDARAQLLANAKPILTTRSSLASSRIVPFVERRLADITDRNVNAIVIDCGDTARVASMTHLPPNVSPIRMERRDNDVVAIAISSALDPMGEVGLGAYWVLRSRDGGATWARYYTGLRANMPYVVSQTSPLPLCDDDRLRIEVAIQELDLDSITFPPIALRTKREERDIVLDMPWSELMRDSDGDRLTDLLEERITTDPHDLDTDGDGISDDEDALPRVARNASDDVAAHVLAAVLDNFAPQRGALITGFDDPAATNSCEIRGSDVSERTLFLVGDPSRFASITFARRVVVLSAAEHELYEKKFGPTYASSILNFVISHDGTRAILELNSRWAGATYLVKKTEHGRETEILTSWIS